MTIQQLAGRMDYWDRIRARFTWHLKQGLKHDLRSAAVTHHVRCATYLRVIFNKDWHELEKLKEIA